MERKPCASATRRLKRLLIDPHEVINGLMPGRFQIEERLVIPELPSDVAVVNVAYDEIHGGFTITLLHADFEPVPIGECIPIIGIERRIERR